ncbi:MAG: hypothetical protein HYV09_36320 [Deltaproteobacteria bacterium]|nr:hypothetical protein [Deltaproteobacteria bacterium]
MRALLLSGLCAIGCETEELRDFVPPPEPWVTQATCGDGVCEVDELRYMCPADCIENRFQLRRELDACLGLRSPREIAVIAELGLELADAMTSLDYGLHAMRRFSWALDASYKPLFGEELLWLVQLHFAFDTKTWSYELTDARWRGAGEVVATSGRSYTAFASGARIPHDLFDPDSYLIGRRIIEARYRDQIAYDRAGPLVELLGQGPTPPNPITIGGDDVRAHVDAHTYTFRLERSGSRGALATTFVVKGQLRPGEYPTFELDVHHGRRTDLGQLARVSAFDVRIGECNTMNLPCILEGSPMVEVTGGPFPYEVVVDLLKKRLRISCPGEEPER